MKQFADSLTRLAIANLISCLALSCTKQQFGSCSSSDVWGGMRYRWRCGGFLDGGVWENNGCHTRAMYFDVALLTPSHVLFYTKHQLRPYSPSGHTRSRWRNGLLDVGVFGKL